MREYFPYGGFKRLKNLDRVDVNSISQKIDTGYFLEVNLEYPDGLHKLHNDYSLAPENLLFLVICCQNTVKKLLIGIK